jgi:metal-responsive CopG/Arc/MetJ family transcriptional regulator
MRRKIEKKKTVISISVDPDILDIINDTIANRSKFIENILIEEICKNNNIKEILKNKKIIL